MYWFNNHRVVLHNRVLVEFLSLDDLLNRGCDRLSDYLATNPNVKPKDQQVCR
jgi:hypothetical protein